MEPRHSLAGAGRRAHRGAQLGPSKRRKARGKLGGSRRADCPGLSLRARGAAPRSSRDPKEATPASRRAGTLATCRLGAARAGREPAAPALFGGRDPFPCAPPAPPGPPAPQTLPGPSSGSPGMRWGGAPPAPRLSAPDTGTQTGRRARGAGKLGGGAGAYLRVRGLSGPRAPACSPAARPFQSPRGPGGRGRRLSALRFGLAVRPPGSRGRPLDPAEPELSIRRAPGSEPAGGGGQRPAVERRRPGAARGSGRGLRAPLQPRSGTWARVGCGGGGRGSECRAGAGRRVPGPALRPAPPPRPRPAATTRPWGSSRAGPGLAPASAPRAPAPSRARLRGARGKPPSRDTPHIYRPLRQNSAGSSGSP